MKENNKIIISIVAVILIGVAVVGATYAYWSWTTAANEQTSVTFTVPSGSSLLSATLDGGTMSVSKLAPTSCGNTKYGAVSTVKLTYLNQTTSNATAYGTLTVSNFTKPHGTTSGTIKPATADLQKLKYSLRTAANCGGTEIKGGDFSAVYNKTTATLFTDQALQSAIAGGTASTTKTMYLYVWLDKSYSFENVGSGVVSDPMQDLSFTLTWTGKITNDPSNQPS